MILFALLAACCIGLGKSLPQFVLGNFGVGREPPANFTPCDSFDIKLSSNIITTSIRPKGLCPYCCPINLKKDISFHLFNHATPAKGKLLPKNKAGAASRAGLRPDKPTVFYIHGFLEQAPFGASGVAVRNAYLSRQDFYNVIIVNWSPLSAGPWYLQAVQNVKLVAKVLADTIRTYHNSGEMPIQSVHIVGFSLGAHIAGFTGKFLSDLKVPRITGLDPAFPAFPIDDTSRRLSKTDAKFVDVIHTSRNLTLGFPISIGHVDFYPNVGQINQPGCNMDALVSENKIDEIFSCSHMRAWEFYSESVEDPTAFPSYKCEMFSGILLRCNNYASAYMGLTTPKDTKGDYYLQTNTKPPYGSLKEQPRTVFHQ